MTTKTLTTLIIVIAGIFFFPIIIGIIGGVFGIVFGVFGAVFGVIGAVFGAIFGAIGAVFGAIFGGFHSLGVHIHRGDILAIGLIILAVAILSRKKK